MKYSRKALLGFAAAANAQVLVPSICPTVGPVVVPTAVVYPLYISTYISAATVFNINGNANITINNAPTNLQTTVTATSTVFSTVTSTVTNNGGLAPTATTVNQQIILAINQAGVKHRRQNAYSGFYASGARVATTCSQAQPLNLINGQLFSTTGGQFSTSPNVQSAPFAPSASVGSITTLFGSNGNFVWLNQAFTGGAATFCLTSAGQVIAAFTSTPAGCLPITFKPLLASSCPGGVNGTSSGTSSATGSVSASGSGSVTGSVTGSASGSATGSVTGSVSATGSVTGSVSGSSVPSGSGTASNSATGTGSGTASAPSGTASTPPQGQPVQVGAPVPAGTRKEKRQATTFYWVSASGSLSTDRTTAATFQLVGNQLYLGYTPFSTNPTTQFQIFSPINPVGSITTSFTSVGGGFNWNNQTFTLNPQGNAVFAVASNTLFAAFQQIPPGATVVTLTAAAPGTQPTGAGGGTSGSASPTSSSPAPTGSSNSTMKKRYNAYHLQPQHFNGV